MKLHERLADYLQGVETSLAGLNDVEFESYVEEVLSSTRANLRIRIRFDGGILLEINEAVVVESDRLDHLDYRYHCQRADASLVFRYDSTPHFPDLPGFPQHKHLPDATIPAPQPHFHEVLAEAQSARP
ncbi:toxin TumE [uncultured Thiocystis sp.]|jgi:hypothetical protein|uniref:toxin TumE n=1 Tax=uncultured Thiocystis sp. TaxID=1202134 RepID=UPI0025DD0C38|nr:DUF6516 family protein [uncultured Thiocystis sp.]